MSYQKALGHVIACSDAGLLPARLDHAGMEQALVVLRHSLGAPDLTTARSDAEPNAAAGVTAKAKRPALTKDPRCVALAEALKPVLRATCPEGAGGYGGALQANLHPADAETLGGMELIRAAMRRAARQLAWQVRTVGYARERLVMVLVQDVREAPVEFADALEADHRSIAAEMHQRMAAHGNERALSALGPAPVEPADSSVPAGCSIGDRRRSRRLALRDNPQSVLALPQPLQGPTARHPRAPARDMGALGPQDHL
ncbi:hypothetical protein [Streptomyces griseorubens]|uniref:hypothetical protein n=1 Tax=Streptomyces griseorubens TaxID=66897 RepID=UPI00351342E0